MQSSARSRKPVTDRGEGGRRPAAGSGANAVSLPVSAPTARLYGAAANIVMATHLLVSAFIVFGGLLVLRGVIPWWVHVPFAAWGLYVHLLNRTCPLTPLEKSCRARAGEQPYEHGFVARYLAPSRLSGRRLDHAVAALIVAANAVIYALVLT